MKKLFVLLAALLPVLTAAEPLAECRYLGDVDPGSGVTVANEPAGCKINLIGVASSGAHAIRVSIGGREVTFSFIVAEPEAAQ